MEYYQYEYTKVCSKTQNLDLFNDENSLENTDHSKNCVACFNKINTFTKQTSRFKELNLEINFTKKEKLVLRNHLVTLVFKEIGQFICKQQAKTNFMKLLLKDFLGVIFSLKIALCSIGAIFMSLFLKYIFT